MLVWMAMIQTALRKVPKVAVFRMPELGEPRVIARRGKRRTIGTEAGSWMMVWAIFARSGFQPDETPRRVPTMMAGIKPMIQEIQVSQRLVQRLISMIDRV
jgi:hypothetical protein